MFLDGDAHTQKITEKTVQQFILSFPQFSIVSEPYLHIENDEITLAVFQVQLCEALIARAPDFLHHVSLGRVIDPQSIECRQYLAVLVRVPHTHVSFCRIIYPGSCLALPLKTIINDDTSSIILNDGWNCLFIIEYQKGGAEIGRYIEDNKAYVGFINSGVHKEALSN